MAGKFACDFPHSGGSGQVNYAAAEGRIMRDLRGHRGMAKAIRRAKIRLKRLTGASSTIIGSV